MKCTDIERFVDAYLDQEFGERERTEFEFHLESCETCRGVVDLHVGTRRAIVTACTVEAPDSLRNSIFGSLGLDEDDDHAASEPVADDRAVRTPLPEAVVVADTWRDWPGWRYVSLAAAATLLAGLTTLGLASTPGAPSPAASSQYLGSLHSAVEAENAASSTDEIVEESLDWHRRQLPMEVTGPSSEHVRGWFRNKVDFPVRLPKFADRRVSVLGARLAKVGNHNAALITLEVDHRKLSVMVFPHASMRRKLVPERAQPRRMMLKSNNGYNVAIVRDGDMAYTFVSDLPRPMLKRLVTTAELR